MNVLEQLASDMADVGREARISGEDETDACLAVVHEFSAGHEVVEVEEARTERFHGYLLPDDKWYKGGHQKSLGILTIIVPRKQEPTDAERLAHLEKLATAVVAYGHDVQRGRRAGYHDQFDESLDALAKAIKRGERDE